LARRADEEVRASADETFGQLLSSMEGLMWRLEEHTWQLRGSAGEVAQQCVQLKSQLHAQNAWLSNVLKQGAFSVQDRDQTNLSQKKNQDACMLVEQDRLQRALREANGHCGRLAVELEHEKKARHDAEQMFATRSRELEELLDQETQLRSAMEATLTAAVSTSEARSAEASMVEDSAHECAQDLERLFYSHEPVTEADVELLQNKYALSSWAPLLATMSHLLAGLGWQHGCMQMQNRLRDLEKELDDAKAALREREKELECLRAESLDLWRQQGALRQILDEVASIEGQISTTGSGRRTRRSMQASFSSDEDSESSLSDASECSQDSLVLNSSVQEPSCNHTESMSPSARSHASNAKPSPLVQSQAPDAKPSPIQKFKETLAADVHDKAPQSEAAANDYDDSSSELSF
jgi:hypothetical protein